MAFYKKVIINVKRKDLKSGRSTSSASFSGAIHLLVDESDLIHDFKFKMDEIVIDKYTTDSWFNPENKSKYKQLCLRNELFKKINIGTSERRPSKKSHMLIPLSPMQVDETNAFANENMDTIKSLIWLLKGNSPSGENKAPSQAEMVTSVNGKLFLFALFTKSLVIDQKHRIMKTHEINEGWKTSEVLSFEEWLNSNEWIKSQAETKQEAQSKEEYYQFRENSKQYLDKYIQKIYSLDEVIRQYRNAFSKNIDDEYLKPQRMPINFVSRGEIEYAHIKPVEQIRAEAIELVKMSKGIEKLMHEISDTNNFVPLQPTLHTLFDSGEFTFESGGEVKFFNKNGEYFKTAYGKYLEIDKKWWTTERNKYLNERNKFYRENGRFKV